jgi:hypothetical protein
MLNLFQHLYVETLKQVQGDALNSLKQQTPLLRAPAAKNICNKLSSSAFLLLILGESARRADEVSNQHCHEEMSCLLSTLFCFPCCFHFSHR